LLPLDPKGKRKGRQKQIVYLWRRKKSQMGKRRWRCPYFNISTKLVTRYCSTVTKVRKNV